jgi:hypothetical protein
MTHERDFDRIARAWLEAGPDQAPDRAVAAVLTAIETTPQVRRPFRWTLGRQIHMSPRTFALVGALTLALVIGGSLITRNQSQIAQPTQTPSPSPVPSSLYQPLIGNWAGASKTLPDRTRSAVVHSTFDGVGRWDVSGTAVVYGRFRAEVALIAADRLTLTTTETGKGCQRDDVGTYRFELSPGGNRLTLTAESDPCLDRQVLAEGDWIRSDCKTGPGIAGGDWDCYGDLEPGTYVSREVNLRHDLATGQPEISSGALTFTVPDGWAHVADNATRFWLMPSTQYVHLHDGVDLDGLFVFGHPQAASTSEGCPFEPQPGVGLRPDDLMRFVTSLPGLQTSAPQSITIHGRAATWVDAQVDPAWKKTCSWFGDAPIVPYVYANTGLSSIAAGWKFRIIFIDIGHGDTVSVEIDSTDVARFDGLIAEAMPIVESFVFAEPGTTP